MQNEPRHRSAGGLTPSESPMPAIADLVPSDGMTEWLAAVEDLSTTSAVINPIPDKAGMYHVVWLDGLRSTLIFKGDVTAGRAAKILDKTHG